MIETLVGKKTGTAKRPTITAARLNGILARAKPAVKEMMSCKIKIPKVKIKEFKKMRGVITSSASLKFWKCSDGGRSFGGYTDTASSVINEPDTK